MTETLHLRRLRVRYRIAADGEATRRRLDGVLARVLDEALEPALARNGVPVEEEICLRTVRAPATVRLDAGDAAAAAAWSATLAAAIAAAIRAGGPDVVRFRSRRAALVDVALGVAAGDLGRAWAWRRLGIWQAGDAPASAARELVRALGREPEAIVAVVAEVAHAGFLPALLGRLEPADWLELAARALAAAGASPGALAAAAAEPTAAAPPAARSSAHLAESAAGPLLMQSRIARRAAAAASGRGVDPAVRAALAALAWLELEPAAPAALGAESAAVVLAAAAAALAAPLAAQADAAARADAEASAGAVGRALDLPALPPGDKAAEAVDAEPAPDRHTTRHGGLLFLLSVLDELGVPQEAPPELERRPLRWTLHRLALALAPVAADDPATLAFAGLAPDAEPPADDGVPASEAEREALVGLGGRVVEELRERLRQPHAAPDALLDLVCRRRAEIVYEPGWIDVRLRLDEVSLDLRRAGLDLDPGWLPWLGAVVRFVYG